MEFHLLTMVSVVGSKSFAFFKDFFHVTSIAATEPGEGGKKREQVRWSHCKRYILQN